MKTIFQNFATKLPEKFHIEQPQQSLQEDSQKWSSRKKIALAAVATFFTLGASFLAYRYASPKIHIPHSPTSNPLNTAWKIGGTLTTLAGFAGLLAYNSTNQTNITQNKSNNEDDETSLSATDFENKTDYTSSSQDRQTNIDKNQNTKEITAALCYNKPNPTHPTHVDIEKLLIDFHAREKINKDLLEELVTTYIKLSTTSPKATMTNEIFISTIISIIHSYQYVFLNDIPNLDQEKIHLNKIIDISDFFTDRTDPMSYRLLEKLFVNIIPNDLDGMSSAIINRAGHEDKESMEIVERSVELCYKALAQQTKILFSKGIKYDTFEFNRMFNFATTLKNFFLISPDFYARFIQIYPEVAWKFAREYIFEYMINKELPPNIMLPSVKDIGDILESMVISARLSFFLDVDEGAASFAIRLMQFKLGIDPKEFERSYPDKNKELKDLYITLCNKKNLKLFNNFVSENDLSNPANQIANELINECGKTFLSDCLLGTYVPEFHQSFLDEIVPLSKKIELSETEKKTVKRLSHFIKSQMMDPSIPQRARLATLALNKFADVIQDEYSVNLIREAYEGSQVKKNPDLDTACLKFLNESQKELNSEIKTALEIPELIETIDELNENNQETTKFSAAVPEEDDEKYHTVETSSDEDEDNKRDCLVS